MEDEPERGALFYLEGADEDGCVWITTTDVRLLSFCRSGWRHWMTRREITAIPRMSDKSRCSAPRLPEQVVTRGRRTDPHEGNMEVG